MRRGRAANSAEAGVLYTDGVAEPGTGGDDVQEPGEAVGGVLVDEQSALPLCRLLTSWASGEPARRSAALPTRWAWRR
ncbi:hypothetical protein BIV25_21655 [Streptomyces sp. MUSC 14]|nr:hypothetical protein BIV25_21655 [Streptomyces sp. MUSC 14]